MNRGSKRGFTALEMATVMAIIVLLALILVPRYWKRTDEARITAAKAEMNQLIKVEYTIQADTDWYVELYEISSTDSPTIDVIEPRNEYPIDDASGAFSRQDLSATWKGPYATINNAEGGYHDGDFRGDSSTHPSPPFARKVPPVTQDELDEVKALQDLIPNDPWGMNYTLQMVSGAMMVYCNGPDKQFDTDDDIVMKF
jgi:prepilin-type N-terminal cleavage/methylation domain-containing protein